MNDTIAALSTPALSGPIGIIRVSGPDAIASAERVFVPRRGPLSQTRDNLLVTGSLIVGGAALDSGMATVMRAPNSYTGEDMAELHLHGSMPVLRAALDALYRQGCRPAEAGEFTKRAFLFGKLDLSQAEAVQDLISAQTRDAARNAAGQLMGKVGRVFMRVYDRLADLLAHFGVLVDYPDEDIEPAQRQDMCRVLDEAEKELSSLLDSYAWGASLREGIKCVILGKPNVGKSSLLNALLGYDRALVTPHPGTTRDTVEESVHLGGVLLRLVDCAGIRETDDPVESLGVERARKQAADAELVLAVVDGSSPLDADDRAVLDLAGDDKAVVIINKSDLPQSIETDALEAAFLHICRLSALTGDGINLLDATLRRMFDNRALYDGSALSNPRQADAVRRALDAARSAGQALRVGVTPDAVLGELEAALGALGELTGRRISDDVLHRIFENFCVGK